MVCFCPIFFLSYHIIVLPCSLSYHVIFFWTEFDLNMPIDEFGAVDFDYLQNLAGKHSYYYYVVFFWYSMTWLII